MFLKNAFLFSFPELLNIVLKLVSGILVARLLGVTNMGIASACSLVMVYAPLLQMGAADGAGLTIYPQLGNDPDWQAINTTYNTAFSFVMLMLLFALIVTVSVLSIQSLSSIMWGGIGANFVAAFLYQYCNFTEGYARFKYAFKRISLVRALNYGVNFLLAIALTYYYGLPGFFIALLLGWVIFSVVVRFVIKAPLAWAFNLTQLKEMLCLGSPLILIGSLLTLMQTVDTWFILVFLGKHDLGLYAVAIIVVNFILLALLKTASLLLQYTREFYGRCKDTALISKAYMQFALLFMSINFALIGLAKVALFILFNLFLVQYKAAYLILDPILLSTFFLGLFHIIATCFVVIDKKRYTVIALCCALPAVIIANTVAIIYFGTLYSVAMAMLVSMVFLSAILLVMMRGALSCRLFFGLLAFLTSLVAGYWLIESIPIVMSFNCLLFKCLFYLCVGSGLVGVLVRYKQIDTLTTVLTREA